MLSEPIENTTQAEYEDVLQDEDSLFGSPPPSPSARGRSPSPALALPSSVSTGRQLGFGSIAQNVGTIALPGSHSHSEPPINPIASSLSLPGGSCTPILPQSLPSSQPQSRQGSIGRNEPPRSALPQLQTSAETRRKPTQSRRQPQKRQPKATTPRPPPPAIPLPDPSQPPPAHFLRNQQALLGHAGLIAGVRPSNLTTLNGTSRGANPSNPIVLDETETESICEPSTLIGRSHIEYFKDLDRSQLPTPSIQEVVDMLIKQKDIFPVLQSILRLLAVGVTGVQTTPASTIGRGWASRLGQSQKSSRPPVKRRKLNRVPAGAADWDVPYPFLDGEGPAAYRQNWMTERGRQLVSQLIGLVKVALDKAAAKKHLEELVVRAGSEEKQSQNNMMVDPREGGKGANHYRDELADATLLTISPDPVEELSTSKMQVSSASQKSEPGTNSTPAPVMTGSDNTMFSDLFSALLSASDSPRPASFDSASAHTPPSLEILDTSQSTNNFLEAFDSSSSAHDTADQSLIDSWMNILQTFPLPEDGLTTHAPSTHDTSLETLFGIDTPSDFSAFASPVSGDLLSLSTTPNPDAQQTLGFPPLDLNQVGNLDMVLNQVASCTSDAISPQVQPPPNLPYDLPTLPRTDPKDAGAQNANVEAAPMDIDPPKPHEHQTSSSSKSPPLSMDIDSLIDPRLLSLSPPNTSQADTTNSRPTAPANNGDIQTSSTFLPSPASSLEPATPSSAGWDMSLPQVAAGEHSQNQGSVEPLPMREARVEAASKDCLAHNSGHTAPSTRPPPQRASLKSRDPPPAPASVAPAPPRPSGVFSVLRVEDWQPPKPQRKLKKADVLKKAEERREALRTRLEQAKLKLWETTIEHGALLQLMRMSGEEESTSSSSGS